MTVYIILLFYYLVFAVIACLGWYNKVRSVVSGVALNFMVLSTVFVPLIIVALYYEIQSTLQKTNSIQLYISYEEKQPYFLLAEILGVVLLLVLIPTLFHKLYRKWYALPEQ